MNNLPPTRHPQHNEVRRRIQNKAENKRSSKTYRGSTEGKSEARVRTAHSSMASWEC
jgi:hypothetical protein